MIETQQVFIIVKTYPTLSKKYDELVCTAGILKDGSWVRIYPLPFRKLDLEKRYKKYQWIELPIQKNTSDVRPESYQVEGLSNIKIIGEPIGTKKSWEHRRQIIFNGTQIHYDLGKLIDLANQNLLSLATFKPHKLIKFDIESTDREWDEEKLKILENKAKQYNLFQTVEEVKREFMIVKKLPYKFFYKFADTNGRESRLMIEDWEIGALYWNCIESTAGNEMLALEKVKQKYWDDFRQKDLHFFLGTTKEFHGRAWNPFVIVGVFPPPFQKQPTLF